MTQINHKQAAENYFGKQSEEEEEPFEPEVQTSIRYYNLEQIFNTFFPDDSLYIGKTKSKKERESKKIEDSNYTYGEVVTNI